MTKGRQRFGWWVVAALALAGCSTTVEQTATTMPATSRGAQATSGASAATGVPSTTGVVTTSSSSAALDRTSTTPPTTASSEPTVVGHSVEGRPLTVQRYGAGPRKVLWIGGIHGDETEGAYGTEQLPAAFAAAGITGVELLILHDANPDGRVHRTRTNVNGVDLNRNFPTKNFDTTNASYGRTPLSQPESTAVHDLIEREHPDLVMVAHSWLGKTFINYDGPAREIAERFSAMSGMPIEASGELGVTTPGSLGSWFGVDHGKPILTIEYLRGSSGEADWAKSKEAILQAIRG